MHHFRFELFHLNLFRRELRRPDRFAVEGSCAFGAKGIASNAGPTDTDPDWQPL